ncbi:MAG: DNA topoisomerase III, partial [bacterium]
MIVVMTKGAIYKMKLIIAEKPSLARDIAAALGVTQRKDGYIEGNGYIVTWCIGHLVELANPEVYDEKLKQWSLATLPFIPETFKYQVNSNTSAQFKVIKGLVNDSRVLSLVNCADAGREGELIFHLVYLLTGCKKPVERLWISSLTKDEILKGFGNLKPASHYAGLRDSAHARQRADWLIGLNITRAFTIKARTNSSFGGKSELYSVGRVQTPTLAFIVSREAEITNFVPEKFYQVVATFDSTVGTYQGLWVGVDGFRIAEEKEAKAIADKVLGQDGVVDKVDKKLVREKAPLLHDLTSLQRVANTKYSLTADQTLKVAQSLYEAKLITYPRTSSQYLSVSVANEIDEHLDACDIGIYSQFVNQIKSSKTGVRLTSRHVQDAKITDHHAIIPTKIKANLSTLDDEQRKVYDLIVRRFLAAFYYESEIEQTTVFTIVLGEKF